MLAKNVNLNMKVWLMASSTLLNEYVVVFVSLLELIPRLCN